jgi:hypothetical protein
MSLAKMEAAGNLAMGASRFRGVGFNALKASLSLKNGELAFHDFRIERPEGKGSGSIVVDFLKDEVRLVNVETTLIPPDVAIWVDSSLVLHRSLTPYRFKNRPALRLNGTVQTRGGSDRTRLSIAVDGSGGMEYTFLGKNLYSPNIRADLLILKDRLKISNLKASLYGGKAQANADISLILAQGDYTADIRLQDVDFPSVTKLYFDYDTSKGKLDGFYKFAGRGDSFKTIDGSGVLRVTEGDVLAIPVLGPFSGIFSEILPGIAYNYAKEASSSFTTKDGIISTDDFIAQGKAFLMLGNGKLNVVEDKMKFNIRINAQGTAGLLLSPVSHLFEYVSDGALSNPTWRPKRLPKAVFGQ